MISMTLTIFSMSKSHMMMMICVLQSLQDSNPDGSDLWSNFFIYLNTICFQMIYNAIQQQMYLLSFVHDLFTPPPPTGSCADLCSLVFKTLSSSLTRQCNSEQSQIVLYLWHHPAGHPHITLY